MRLMFTGFKLTTKNDDHGYWFKGVGIGSDREKGSNTVLKHVFYLISDPH